MQSWSQLRNYLFHIAQTSCVLSNNSQVCFTEQIPRNCQSKSGHEPLETSAKRHLIVEFAVDVVSHRVGRKIVPLDDAHARVPPQYGIVIVGLA